MWFYLQFIHFDKITLDHKNSGIRLHCKHVRRKDISFEISALVGDPTISPYKYFTFHLSFVLNERVRFYE